MKDITALKFIYKNGDTDLIDYGSIGNLYIGSINNEGLEIPFDRTIIKNKMVANLFIIKILNNCRNYPIISNNLKKMNLVEIVVIMNNKSIDFIIPSSDEPFIGNSINEYQRIYEDNSYCGLLLSEQRLKFEANLFL